ncbi:class I SAM-dependent methyltransferase [Lentzea sp. NBRC 102530]|uniref:class I SAM-dependent methyltransferase n=1 Tax=Lentzea sp. NBRC 102530 TaxID=3032201 RepID=UPI0024A3D214|nr:class I SAM-dependent methyltransferase [Lentzea sp. NBRC 102530]GLY50646.1 methyltransferase type 11 [Lentzea sp. NBRC 102530]
MVTLPPHSHRAVAESFGTDPARYDRTRATYPEAVLDRLPGRDFLDVGCGTGIVARQLLGRGRTVLGVEPDARMAEFARGTGVAVEVATFEEWEPAGRTFDAVVSGTAWHWIDPVAGARKAAQVLRPGGVLAPFGHVYELPDGAAEAFARAFGRFVPDSPVVPRTSMLDAYRGLYVRAAEGIREAGGFGEPEIWRHDWERVHTRAELLDLIPTSGGLTMVSSSDVDSLLAEVAAEVGDVVTLRYATWGLTAARR